MIYLSKWNIYLFLQYLFLYIFYVFFLLNEKLISVTRLKLKKKIYKIQIFYCNVAVEIETKLGLRTRH